MTAPPSGYSRKPEAGGGGTVAPPPGYSRKPVEDLQSKYSLMPQVMDDTMRIVSDSMTRGYLDKLMGGDEQELTRQARERTSDWVETPADIAGAVIASPYRIGSAAVGAAAGGLEGAASAYGHQKDWIPDWQGTKDILKGAGIGAATGGLGAKVGEWIGGRQANKAAEAARPFPTDESLTDAAGLAQREALDAERKGFDDLAGVAGTQADDLAERAARVAQIRSAQGSSRDEFAKMMSGMEGASPETLYKAADIGASGGKSLLSKAGSAVDKLPGKEFSVPLLVAETIVGHGVPWKTLAGMGLKHAVSSAGKKAAKSAEQVPAKAIEDLAVGERSGPLNIDQATIDKWRDRLSKAAAGYGRSQ